MIKKEASNLSRERLEREQDSMEQELELLINERDQMLEAMGISCKDIEDLVENYPFSPEDREEIEKNKIELSESSNLVSSQQPKKSYFAGADWQKV